VIKDIVWAICVVCFFAAGYGMGRQFGTLEAPCAAMLDSRMPGSFAHDGRQGTLREWCEGR
jgi:hypothetical protein